MLFLAAGMLLGGWTARYLPLVPEHSRLLEGLCEAALVVTLFCTGLRCTVACSWSVWRAPVRLAVITLPATLVLLACFAGVLLGLPFAQALLLGAILAPTDAALPLELLPAESQREDVSFTLAAEGALSSSLALPAALLGLGLLGRYEAGPFALRWLLLDVLWAVPAGALLGVLIGRGAARLLARVAAAQPGLTELLLLASALALTYGTALLLRANGLIAAFCAGAAIALSSQARTAAPAVLARRLAQLAQPIERAAEWLVLLVLGALLVHVELRATLFIFALVLLALVRPIAARLGLAGLGLAEPARQVLGWFGTRGAASLYLLLHATNEGLPTGVAAELMASGLAVLAMSVALHGLSALPLSKRPVDLQG